MFSRRDALLGGASLPLAGSAVRAASTKPIAADWPSLAERYRVPDWFRDAKLGIWAHWGPQCEPEFGDWYGRLMYVQGHPAYDHHVRNYGHPSNTGFLDIIGRWKAERWRPEELIQRYAKAGARYFMAMACHHDNLDLFASRHHAWNSTRVGPKRDIVGTWEPLARQAGMKFGVSNHAGHAWHWWQVAYGYDAEGPRRGQRYDAYWLRKHHGRGMFWEGLDPQELYTGPYYVPPRGLSSAAAMNAWHDQRDGQWMEAAPPANMNFVRNWLLRQKQLVEDYRPDIIYLDHYGLPFGEYGLEAAAHYYNQAVEWHGATDVVMTVGKPSEFERRALVGNVERGFVDGIDARPWQTATCIGQWHYSRPVYDDNAYKSAKQVIQRLADVVSKNGNLLLSIPVRGDGTIDEKEAAIVDDIAAWNAANGEAIFGTRPWRVFGEGPTRPPSGDKVEDQANAFTAADVRYTQKDGALYAIFLDSAAGIARLQSLGGAAMPDAVIERIDLLGGPEIRFRRDAAYLELQMPELPSGSFVPAIRIRGRGLA